jgi:hypothetical protein
MKKLISVILSIVLVLSTCSFTVATAGETVEYSYTDMSSLVEQISTQDSLMEAAHNMAEAARALGYEENHDVIKLAQEEWWNAYYQKKELKKAYNDLKARWNEKEKEYPIATYIWNYFKDLGYSDYVCAGLLGNMMGEVGGNTLVLQPFAQSKYYYGICQWSKSYSQVWGASLEEQCNFLRDTIKYEIDTFGYCYSKGFKYENFLKLTSASDAALCFAKTYERGASYTYKTRQNNAIVAYNYFTK